MVFTESFMKFIFPDDDVFLIENDKLHLESKDKKACECVVKISPNVCLIEAKSSFSNLQNNEQGFKDNIDEIKQKFADSIDLFTGIRNKVYGEEAYNRLPVNLRAEDLKPSDYVVCLIINGHRLDWLNPIMEWLKRDLKDVLKLWGMKDSNVKVYNEQIAKEHNFIVAFVPKEHFNELREPNGNPDKEKVMKWFKEHGE